MAAEHGLPADALWSEYREAEPFDVWPENWDAVRLFQACSTQWRRNGMGMETGLDYHALDRPEQQLRLHGRKAREAFWGLQVLEVEWLTLRANEARSSAR